MGASWRVLGVSCGALGWSCEGLVELLEGSLVMLSGLGDGLESEGSTWVVLEPTSPVEARAKIAPELRLPMFQSFQVESFVKVSRRKNNKRCSGQFVTSPLGEGRGDQDPPKTPPGVPRAESPRIPQEASRTPPGHPPDDPRSSPDPPGRPKTFSEASGPITVFFSENRKHRNRLKTS